MMRLGISQERFESIFGPRQERKAGRHIYCRECGKTHPESEWPHQREIMDQPFPTPQVFGDLPGYRSPIDGRWIEGRRARKYDMESNNCVDGNEFKTSGKLRNERFAKKHGLGHMLDK